ncbi:hypothetical protein RI129_007200 [Pyrocoelia pectoralis]|uniref:aralkylamine N-acetyltransferase n=1 Tax=Pyrocoelia pectoralis TaxID=417401 RepID=A0AAN7ZEQ8_9COLE
MAFRIRLATVGDREKISEHVREFFRRDEPLSRYLKLSELCDKKEDKPPEENKKQEVSVVATDEFSNIIGVSLNELVHKDDPNVPFTCSNSEIQKIVDLIDHIEGIVDVFNKYPNVNSVLHIHVLSVAPTWRRKNLAAELINETRKIANQVSASLIQMECTSYYSAQLALKLNFHCIYQKKYTDYLVNGKQMFFPEHPHEEIGVYVQHLNKDQ